MNKDKKNKPLNDFMYWFLLGLTVLMELTIIFCCFFLINRVGELDTQLETEFECELGYIGIDKGNNSKIWDIKDAKCSGKMEYTPMIFLMEDN